MCGNDFLHILDELDDAILIIDHRQQIIEANRPACNLYGYTRHQLCRLSLPELAEGNRQRRSNGSLFVADIIRRPLLLAVGAKPVTVVKVRDITKATAAAAISPATYQDLIENGLSLVIRIMPDTTLTFVNDRFCRYFGLHRDIALGRRFSDLLLDADDREFIRDYFASYADRPKNTIVDRMMTCASGERRWLQFTESPIVDAAQNLRQLQLVALDIHEQKSAQIRLQQSEAKYRAIMDQANEGIILMDLFSGQIREVNKRISEICGFNAAELLSFTNYELSTETPDEAREAGLKLKYDAILPSETIRLNTRGGGTVEVDRMGKRLDIDGQVMALFSVRDVSEKRRIEAQLRQQTDELKKRVDQLQKAWSQTIDVLAAASEAKDPYTSGHQKRVAQLAEAIGQGLGLSEEQLTGLRMAALIHDIGKITVPADILSKPGILSNLERQMVQLHVTAGYDLLKNLDLPWNVAQVVLQHHERLDGSGYPAGLRADEILFKSRILAVADVVEAMSSHRPYRPALGIETGLAEIRREKGSLYDPLVVDACLRVFMDKNFVLA